jgi:hypothetical protein
MVKSSRKLTLNYFVLSPMYIIAMIARFGFEVVLDFFVARFGFERCKAPFSHFVSRDTSHLSKTISSFLGWYDYNILDEKTITLFAKYFLFKKFSRERATSNTLLSETW